MIKPSMPNIPGFGAMTETLDFVKNMWGGMSSPGMGIPGMVMPTLSVEEIDKQIKDLKAVESWLTVNMSMLRGTIQALEVQSATISTLKSMGESLTAGVKQTAAGASNKASNAAAAFPFSFPATAAAVSAKAAAKKPTSEPEPEPQPQQVSSSAEPDYAQSAPAIDQTAAQQPAASFTPPMPNPAAWWNMLQDQFKQAVGTAMAAEPASTTVRKKPKAQPAAEPVTPARKRKTAPK